MRQSGVLLLVLVGMVARAPIAAADLERAPLRPPVHSLSELPTPEGTVYIPSWADRLEQMPYLGVFDESMRTYPFDEHSGPSPLDPDAF